MPTRYSTPGVYVERFDADPQRLGVRRTDIAGFIGIAERGPLHVPIRVESVRQFTSLFGAPLRFSYLAYAVAGFFLNGGRRCWVVRVADPSAARAASRQIVVTGRGRVTLEAMSPGAWGNTIEVEGVWGRDAIALLAVRTPDGRQQVIDLDEVLDEQTPPAQRTVSGIAEDQLPELAPDLVVRVVPDSPWTDLGIIDATSRTVRLTGGKNGLETLTAEHFTGEPDGRALWGMDALSRIDGVSFVAAPDLHAPAEWALAGVEIPRFGSDVIRDAQIAIIGQCMKRGDRIALIDLPRDTTSTVPLTVAGALNYREGFPRTSYAAAYYPWLIVDDPLQLSGIVRRVPPSGHVAGVFARSDLLRGLHKPPANEPLEGVYDVAATLDDGTHGRLNDGGINAVRPIPGRGVLVLGARTLDPDIRWRYVNVRRLFAYIEEVLDEEMQWAVFEPGNPALWTAIDRSIRGFLERLYREGKLDGATADAAYFVRCDATTNPPWETDAGRVTCLIGIQPPYPAEFVVVRIGVTRNGIEIDTAEAANV
jgi:hypothetical protein